jgi:photosystem II stability/assembly factor-like uncharacterized protein
MTRIVAIALTVCACAAVTAPARAAEIPSPWAWTDYGADLQDLSCVTAQQCVAVGRGGAVLRSPGVGEQPLAWSFVALQPETPAQPKPVEDANPTELDGVWCSTSSCIAVSNRLTPLQTVKSWVYRSTDVGATWSPIQQLPGVGPDKTASALDVACDPSPATAAQRNCYVVGPDGGVWRSQDDGLTWAGLAPPTSGAQRYDSVECAGPVCVVAGGTGAAAVSAARLEGNTVKALKPPTTLTGSPSVSCPTSTQCVVASGGTYATVATADGTFGKALKLRKDAKDLTAVSLSCPAARTCLTMVSALGEKGKLAARGLAMRTSTLGDGNDWQRRPLGTLDLASVDCIGDTCVAAGKHASWFVSTNAGNDWNVVNEVPKLDLADCQAQFAPVCTAGGEKDLTQSHSGGEFWFPSLRGYTGLNVKNLTCTTPTTCLILGKNQSLYTTDMETFGPRKATLDDPKGTDALTCITDLLCVGLNEGVAYTTQDGAVTDWSQSGFPERGGSIWCTPAKTDPATCYALTREFIVRGTMTLQGGLPKWTWVNTDADPPGAKPELEAIGCDPTGSQCTAVGLDGLVMTTTTDPMHWTAHTLPVGSLPGQRPIYKSVKCVAVGVCLVGGSHGTTTYVLSTTNNWQDYSVDKLTGVDGEEVSVHGFSCVSVNRCLAIGGTSLIGARNPPLT